MPAPISGHLEAEAARSTPIPGYLEAEAAKPTQIPRHLEAEAATGHSEAQVTIAIGTDLIAGTLEATYR